MRFSILKGLILTEGYTLCTTDPERFSGFLFLGGGGEVIFK